MAYNLAMCVSAAVGGPRPEFVSVLATQVTVIECGGGWTINVGWVLDVYNDVAYYIDIVDIGLATIATGLLPSAGNYLAAPADTGQIDAFGGVFHDAEYIVELRRVGTGQLIASMLTNRITVETGPPC